MFNPALFKVNNYLRIYVQPRSIQAQQITYVYMFKTTLFKLNNYLRITCVFMFNPFLFKHNN